MKLTASSLARRGLAYYWRTNVAVVLGVATAVAVMAGALLVGDSVRGSLRDLVLQRLGRTDLIVASAGFFREQLADDIRANPSFESRFDEVVPLILAQGLLTGQESGRRAGQVRVYGVDDRFWRFHGVADISGPLDREALISPALAREIDGQPGSTVLLRVERPSEIPLESLHGRKEDVGRTVRLTVRAVAPSSMLGEFSLEAQQGDVRALFVPLSRLQNELDLGGRVNALLVSTLPAGAANAPGEPVGPGGIIALEQLVRAEATLGDVGLTVRSLDARGAIVIGSNAGLLDDALAAAVQETLVQASSGIRVQPVFTYLANSLRSGARAIPYSLVTATDLGVIAPALASPPDATTAPIVLNEWAATELRASVGDAITMEYYVWEEPGLLANRTAEFSVAAVVPIEAGDRDLAPAYPGISDSPSLADWDPPFPIDLRRIRPVDETYWNAYRTTPKAFVPLEVGQRLWRSRYGALTSIRARPPEGGSLEAARGQIERRLQERIDPIATGLAVRDVRTEGLAASRGATDFGEYFVYFSFFLVVSALLLVVLFFKLGVEQRAREVGLLRAVGFNPTAVRRLFLREGLLLAIVGSAVGVMGALAYASLIMIALATWWVGAVGTTALTLHVSWISLAAGAVGGLGAAVACIWWTLAGLARASERTLLAGQLTADTFGARGLRPVRRFVLAAITLSIAGAALVAGALGGLLDQAGAFFGAGAALLAASLAAFAVALRVPFSSVLEGRGWWPVSRLGLRNTTHRPGRSVLSVAIIASATFVLIAVDAFRRDSPVPTDDRRSGVGGYQLLVESLLPVVHDPNSREGRQTLNLSSLGPSVSIEPFRLLPGDDASCLNLYEPRNPRILAPRDSFLAEGRFAFQDSLAATDAERANPWLLLNRAESGGPGPVVPIIPVIADANSMTYVLHRRLGEDIVITRGSGEIRLRIVAALRDSIFQRELLMSQANFLRLFPEQQGYQLMLVESPAEQAPEVAARIEEALGDLGADAIGTAERLAEFHRVENTYLSTFQTLGGLGLLLGTVGLATVLLRNVLERRRELALLGAVGYRRRHFLLMVLAENALLLVAGLSAGAVCAALAIAPAIAERGGRMPLTHLSSSGALLVLAVFATGLLSSVIATRAAIGGPLLQSLRSE
ncbi:MAG TPA: FtsX-like permease family protein [Vicinamibacterales bacterium]|nr:FtsX-like permease family protein [Vicinamibacterales bacterium]